MNERGLGVTSYAIAAAVRSTKSATDDETRTSARRRDDTDVLDCGQAEVIVYLIGVHHFDPLSRILCERHLRNASQEYPDRPAFVATEWDSGDFLQVKAQRPHLRQLFQARWPKANRELLDYIEQTPGFEADTHEGIFPGARVLWLDEGRRDRQGSVASFADYCFALYQGIIGDAQLPCDTNSTLRHLHQGLWKSTEAHEPNYDRDFGWAETVKSHVEQEGGTWGTAIVGAGHLQNDARSFRCLLEACGYECRTISCRI